MQPPGLIGRQPVREAVRHRPPACWRAQARVKGLEAGQTVTRDPQVNQLLSSNKAPDVTERLDEGVPLLAAPGAGEPDEDIANK